MVERNRGSPLCNLTSLPPLGGVPFGCVFPPGGQIPRVSGAHPEVPRAQSTRLDSRARLRAQLRASLAGHADVGAQG